MKYKLKRLLIVLLNFVSLLFYSCTEETKDIKRNIEPGFYYWRSVFKPTGFEKEILLHHKARTLYIKFFDVAWNEKLNLPLPQAQIRIADSVFLKSDSIKIIPVVFITNECIKKIGDIQVKDLGKKISGLVKNICEVYQIKFNEIQIDCDWTATSKENYFALLQTIKSALGSSRLVLSCTIRLHQIKYSVKTGIPPVDRGLLMAYNMGNLKDPAAKNSILEVKELKKYLSNLASYPLVLDIGLPLFEWKILYRDNVYAGLIGNLPDSFLINRFVEKKDNRFLLLQDTIINGYELKKNDVIRKEESNYEEILSAEKIINHSLHTAHFRLVLFHLDSVILSKYSANEMENIFNGMR